MLKASSFGCSGEPGLAANLPRHLYRFPRSSRVLRDVGFELLRSECLGGAQLSFVLSLRQLSTVGRRPSWWQQPLVTFMSGVTGRLLSVPFWLVSRVRQATIVSYAARKV